MLNFHKELILFKSWKTVVAHSLTRLCICIFISIPTAAGLLYTLMSLFLNIILCIMFLFLAMLSSLL